MGKPLASYIPAKHRDKIEEIYRDSDGIWVFLKDGWGTITMGEDCHVIHEDTIKQVLEVMKGIIPNRAEAPGNYKLLVVQES